MVRPDRFFPGPNFSLQSSTLPIIIIVTCSNNLTNKCNNITCDIQYANVVTMAMKVLHNTYNTCICDLPDMHALSP